MNSTILVDAHCLFYLCPASGTLIRESHFEQFAVPYLKELIANIVRYAGSVPSVHICGNSKKI